MNSNRLKQLYHFLEERPDDAFILFAIAKEYEGLGNDEKAKSYYLKLTDNHSDYVGTYYHLGKLYEREEEWKFAELAYQKGMEVSKAAGDKHAYGELRGALEFLSDDF